MLSGLLLCYSGFTALCLSMERHHVELLGRKPSPFRCQGLRAGGWLLLAVSLWAAVTADGWGLGLVEWFAILMLSAVLLVLLMPYRPRLTLALAWGSVLLSPVTLLAQW